MFSAHTDSLVISKILFIFAIAGLPLHQLAETGTTAAIALMAKLG